MRGEIGLVQRGKKKALRDVKEGGKNKQFVLNNRAGERGGILKGSVDRFFGSRYIFLTILDVSCLFFGVRTYNVFGIGKYFHILFLIQTKNQF